MLYFLDECSIINQGELEDVLCLTPFMIQPLHPGQDPLSDNTMPHIITVMQQLVAACKGSLQNQTFAKTKYKSSIFLKRTLKAKLK
jgi:hypothetical protein